MTPTDLAGPAHPPTGPASANLQQIAADFRAAHPDPSDGLAHTLSVYADEPDESFVIIASGNIYGDGVRTGLTWGDLRRVAGAAQ